MNIELKEELLMNSHKTLDGRGADVHIAGGACLTAENVSNITIHGISIHDCKPTGPADMRLSPDHIRDRGRTDGDAVTIRGSRDIWLDHNHLYNSADGLVHVVEGSKGITISNNYFINHNKVMLFGANAADIIDIAMQVTVAFNHFGEGLTQRIPR
nr:probable pectate lyase 8 [Physcomitrium patens]|eukprot:XP_024383274.1 probable pectate lyase 8 [Physcomitrella patens]